MYVIYTKSKCLNCAKAKLLLSAESKILINCDDLLETDRQSFISEMEKKMKCEFKSFPIIFIDDDYLGSYEELVDHLQFELVEEF